MKKYCWQWKDSDAVSYKFDTEQECIKDASGSVEPGSEEYIWVGECKDVVPSDYTGSISGELLSRLEEIAYADDGIFVDEEMFFFKDGKEDIARDELRLFLEEWANRYVTSNTFVMSDKKRLVKINEKGEVK